MVARSRRHHRRDFLSPSPSANQKRKCGTRQLSPPAGWPRKRQWLTRHFSPSGDRRDQQNNWARPAPRAPLGTSELSCRSEVRRLDPRRGTGSTRGVATPRPGLANQKPEFEHVSKQLGQVESLIRTSTPTFGGSFFGLFFPLRSPQLAILCVCAADFFLFVLPRCSRLLGCAEARTLCACSLSPRPRLPRNRRRTPRPRLSALSGGAFRLQNVCVSHKPLTHMLPWEAQGCYIFGANASADVAQLTARRYAFVWL